MSTSGSTLPPDRTTTTGPRPASSSGAAMSAATPAEPDASTTSFARSASSSIARERSSSATVSTGMRCVEMISNGTLPGTPTAMPSAIVRSSRALTGWPTASDSGYAAAWDAWTPITCTSGRSSRDATMPAARPPPPTGTSTVRTSGTCSAISRPAVPWPATMSTWSNGWTSTAPDSCAYAWAATSESSSVAPEGITRAPYALVAETLGSAASSGMKTTASMPSICAARATPWAWLPALAATTPCAFCSSDIRESRV